MEKLRLLLVRERELSSLRQEYSAYRTWMEKIHSVMLRLATHNDRGQMLQQLVASLVSDFSFEYAAAISETAQIAAGTAPETASDFGMLTRAIADARSTGDIGVTTVPIDIHSSALTLGRLGWLLAAPVHVPSQTSDDDLDFVLLVGRSPRASAFNPPPWDRDIDRIRHLRDTVAHVLAAVDARAALIVERNKLEAEVLRATAQLTAALAIAERAKQAAIDASHAKSNFLASMSHELRTPLNALVGYSEMLLEDAEALGATSIIEGAHSMQRAGGHLRAIVTDILDLSKIEARQVELSLARFELGPLIAQAIELVKPSADRRDNALVLDMARDPGVMYADAVKLQQVLVNLLGNACKFTDTGTITVRVLTGTNRAGVPGVAISIIDTGIGMTAAQLGQLFDPYRQLHVGGGNAPEGTGLGLFISRRLCQLMGGDITAHSMPGHGSTFMIQLPRDVAPLPAT